MTNLTQRISDQLPPELLAFVQQAGEMAKSRDESLYLVGGLVRDLLLQKTSYDVDLVVEGDAATLALCLLPEAKAKITIHRRFNTAKLRWRQWSIDLATARRESYPKPGALPVVRPDLLKDDLQRRDFSINAMAIALNPDRFGEFIDPYRGQHDLEHKLIRVLYSTSFSDDATRIWRGIRYEQRFGFHLETGTLKLLKRSISMLDTVSGERLRYELECILEEEQPEKALKRVAELDVMANLHPALQGDNWLKASFAAARKLCSPERPSPALYMSLLTYRLTDAEKEQLTLKLRLTRAIAAALKDTSEIKKRLKVLTDPTLKPSQVFRQLHSCSKVAVMANLLAGDPAVQTNIRLYYHKLRFIRTALNGNDLQEMGVVAGPSIREVLNRLLEARLDGEINSRQDEERLVEKWRKENR
jgi:tRNA nucleotidyltransferase (CCA-adding enzyme)